MPRFSALVGLLLSLALAPAATATVRVADPAGAGTACTDAAPCPITTAINSAVANDEVVLNPGDYGSVASPITTALASHGDNVTIHGRAGSARPHIVSSNVFALTVGGVGSAVRDIALRSVYATNGDALYLLGSALAERVEVRADGTGSFSCLLNASSAIRDATCVNTGAGTALIADGTACCSIDATARNVTAITTGAVGSSDFFGNAVAVHSTSTRSSMLALTNVIADGAKHDIEVNKEGAAAVAHLDHVDAADVHLDGGASAVDLGGNITAAPQFVNAGAFDFHELASSPTVDAGSDDPSNGPFAFDFTARTLGAHTDIGAAEYIPSPTATTGVASAVGTTTATVAGTANANGGSGSVSFEYGTTVAYGQSTPGVPISGTTDTATTATLTGLAPDTTYHYRVVASTSSGTVLGADGTFTTQPAPSALHAPVLSQVSQSHRVWRVDRRHKTPAIARKRPRGTRFKYTLSADATVQFTIQRLRAHKRPKTAMRLRRAAHGGLNTTKFTGRVGRKVLKPGRYRVVIRASNSAGASAAKTLRFRVTRG